MCATFPLLSSGIQGVIKMNRDRSLGFFINLHEDVCTEDQKVMIFRRLHKTQWQFEKIIKPISILFDWSFDWLIDSNDISTRLGLFYA